MEHETQIRKLECANSFFYNSLKIHIPGELWSNESLVSISSTLATIVIVNEISKRKKH